MDQDHEGAEDQAPRVIEIGIADEISVADPLRYKQSGPGGPHFEWKSYLDLLAKARRDLSALRSGGVDSDGLFNFLATAAHVSDWIKNDLQMPSPLKLEVDRLVHPKPVDPVGPLTISIDCVREPNTWSSPNRSSHRPRR